MIPKAIEGHIQEFVTSMTAAAGQNLECIVLYGSASNGEYHADYSNVNLLCILRDTSLASLERISKVVGSWTGRKQPAPLIVTRAELERSTDVFSIELLDMKHQHKILVGDDVLATLEIPLNLHRVQVEYELREKLILLRQRALVAVSNDKHLWELLVGSVASFATLFRHALIALGEASPATKREATTRLAQIIGFDASSVEQVLDVREHKITTKDIQVKPLFARYLEAIERVTAAVDKALEP
jgi:hypothetical protein